MVESKSTIDKGLVEIDGFELKSECIYHPIKGHYILMIKDFSEEIIEEINSIAEKLILNVKCNETYFVGEYMIDKKDLKKTREFSKKLSKSLIGVKLEYNISCFNDNGDLVGFSDKYSIDLEKPDIDIESDWISFKEHPSYSLHPDLFWVIKLPFQDKVKIIWNDDIKNLKVFINSFDPRHARKQKYFFSLFGMSLKTVQLYSIFDVVMNDEDVIKKLIEKLPDYNIFYKKRDCLKNIFRCRKCFSPHISRTVSSPERTR